MVTKDQRLNVRQLMFPGIHFTVTSYTDDLMVSRLDFEPHTSAPAHHHPEDEVNIVLSGEFECEIDGKVCRHMPGESFLVRGNQTHLMRSLDTAGSVATIWGPVRNDLLELFVHGAGRPVIEG